MSPSASRRIVPCLSLLMLAARNHDSRSAVDHPLLYDGRQPSDRHAARSDRARPPAGRLPRSSASPVGDLGGSTSSSRAGSGGSTKPRRSLTRSPLRCQDVDGRAVPVLEAEHLARGRMRQARRAGWRAGRRARVVVRAPAVRSARPHGRRDPRPAAHVDLVRWLGTASACSCSTTTHAGRAAAPGCDASALGSSASERPTRSPSDWRRPAEAPSAVIDVASTDRQIGESASTAPSSA